MTDSSSKLLQIQGKWYQERKQQTSKTWAKKQTKNYSEPFNIYNIYIYSRGISRISRYISTLT